MIDYSSSLSELTVDFVSASGCATPRTLSRSERNASRSFSSKSDTAFPVLARCSLTTTASSPRRTSTSPSPCAYFRIITCPVVVRDHQCIRFLRQFLHLVLLVLPEYYQKDFVLVLASEP